ncbi:MAG: glycoside hydrolase family 3 N-terminal domain-containing protein [Planctomycetota bacterium]
MRPSAALAQMFMTGVRGAEPDDPDLEEDLAACHAVGIKGVMLFSTRVPDGGDVNIKSPDQLRRLTDHIRDRLGPDTLIAIDQEGGRVARLGPAHGFAETLCASEYARLPMEDRQHHAARLAAEVADAGIDWNMAPSVDVDHDPSCPVIGGLGRSFSDDPEEVIARGREIIEAHHAHGLAACMKHFPGHGAAAEDSHLELPDITDRHRGEYDISPFRALIGESHERWGRLVGVMTAHVLHRDLDAEHPASLSKAVTTGLLREQLGFDGMVITDSLDMGAIRSRHSLRDACRLAVLAGADVILNGCNGPTGDTAADFADVARWLSAEADQERLAVGARITRSAERRAQMIQALHAQRERRKNTRR